MKNKGFTLVEVLAVIVILALLITVAVPSVIGISKRVKANMFCSKVKDIESAAKLYGEDYVDEFGADAKYITICDLINNSVYKKEGNKKDKNGNEYNNCYCEVYYLDPNTMTQAQKDSLDNPCVTDPRDGTSMDKNNVEIKIINKRINAEYIYKNEEDKNSCK